MAVPEGSLGLLYGANTENQSAAADILRSSNNIHSSKVTMKLVAPVT